MEYYWELKYGTRDDMRSALIAPDKVEVIAKRLGNGDPIYLSTAVIPANQVRSFEQTDKAYGQQKLLEDASQAFKEPIETDMGEQNFLKADGTTGTVHYKGIKGRWVKMEVTQNKWEKFYSAIAGYKLLRIEGGIATVAFILAVHDINQQKTPYCTEQEIQQLTRSQ